MSQNTALPEFICSSLDAPVDYTPSFTASIDALKNQLAAALHVPIRHDTNMNYCAGQSLAFSMQATRGSRLRLEIQIHCSSKAPLFAIYVLDRLSAPHPLPLNQRPPIEAHAIEQCRQALQAQGWREVNPCFFNEPAPGCLTEMDGLPVTVFAALFSEMV